MKFEYQIIEQTDAHLKVSMSLTKSMDCFDGHFDEVAIMPAVAQLYIVEKIAQENFKDITKFKGLQQVKFVGPIVPETQVTINFEVDYSKLQITFQYEVNRTLKSKGKINFQSRQEHE